MQSSLVLLLRRRFLRLVTHGFGEKIAGQGRPRKGLRFTCYFVFHMFSFSLMKQAYLEIALVFTSNTNALEPPKTPDQPPHTAERIPSGVTECRKINKKGCAKETEG